MMSAVRVVTSILVVQAVHESWGALNVPTQCSLLSVGVGIVSPLIPISHPKRSTVSSGLLGHLGRRVRIVLRMLSTTSCVRLH